MPNKYLFAGVGPGIRRQQWAKDGRAGFDFKIDDQGRVMSLDLAAGYPRRQAPGLLFDAADPGNLGWFSRCRVLCGWKMGRGFPDAAFARQDARDPDRANLAACCSRANR